MVESDADENVHPESLSLLNKRYKASIITVGTTILVIITVLVSLQAWGLLTHSDAAIVQSLNQRSHSIQTLNASFSAQLTAMQRTAENFYLRSAGDAEIAIPELRLTSDKMVLTLDHISDEQKERSGNIFSVASSAIDQTDRRRQIAMAQLLFEMQSAFHQANAQAALSYFISGTKFSTIYPWMRSSDVEAAIGMGLPNLFSRLDEKVFEFWEKSLPAANPGRTPFWTTPYLDPAGNGIMVTHGTPAYANDRFLGMIAIDITLSSLSNSIRINEMPGGTILLIDADNNVVAASDMSEHEISFKQLEKVIPADVASEVLRLLEMGGAQKGDWGGTKLYTNNLDGSPWRLIYLLPNAELYFNVLMLNMAPFSAFVLILILGLWTIHNYIVRNFLRPSIASVRKIDDESRKLSHVVKQSPSMIFITNVEGEIEYINPKFTEISGYTAAESIGQNARILRHEDTPLHVYEELWRTIKAGREWRSEIKDRCKDGSSFWAYATISVVKNEAGKITNYVSMHEDITLRKEMQLRERQAKEQAETASRSKSELLANMSHELRTPLNAIIGFSDSMQAEVFGSVGSDKNREYLDDINHSGQHLLNLINDILDVSAIEAGAIELYEEHVSVADVVDASIRIINPRANDGRVTVSSLISSETPQINADGRRVKQIFLNLLSNAVKFTPEGGEVSVSSWFTDNGSLAISVADTGMGMDEDEIEKSLSKFGQVDSGLDRKYEGTGLGLPLTIGLMESHGGTLELKSERGQGTQAIVTFPKERVVS